MDNQLSPQAPSQAPDQQSAPSPEPSPAPSQDPSLQVSDSDKLQLSDRGETDDIDAAVAAAKAALPGGDSEGDSAEDSQTVNAPKREAASKPEESPAPAPDKARPSEWARLHRQQKEFFEQKQAFKAEQAEMQRIKSVLENAKSDRLAALELMGFAADKDGVKEFLEGLAQDGGRLTPERKELNELKAWRKQQEEERQQQQQQFEAQQQQAQLQQKLDGLRTEIREKLAGDDYASRYVSVKNADEQVMLEMDRMASETGAMPDIGEAIDRVEANFSKGLEELAQNPAVLSFFERKLGARQSDRTDTPQSKPRAPRTISGKTPPPSLQPPKSSRPLSDDEEVEAVIANMKAMAR